MEKQRPIKIRFIPSIIWMSVIFFFSSRSTTGIGGDNLTHFLIFKTFHLIEYFILFCLLFFAYRDINYAICTAYIYAMSDEYHQTFTPGREGKLVDTFIDLIGILIGVIFITKTKNTNIFKRILAGKY